MAFYYKGKMIPDIPTDVDRSIYPYLHMSVDSNGVNYYATFESKWWYYDPSTSKYCLDANNEICEYIWNSSYDSWQYVRKNTTDALRTEDACPNLYISHDILNKDTNEVHMKSYNGVPLLPISSDIDREAYPYVAVAMLNMSFVFTVFYLVVSDTPICYKSSVGFCLPAGSKSYIYVETSSTPDSWDNTINPGNPSTSDTTLNQDGSTVEVVWVDYDILNSETGEVEIPSSEPKEEPDTPSEPEEDQDYRIKGSTLRGFGDQARRLGETTAELSPQEMIDIFTAVVPGGGSQLEAAEGVGF